MPRFVDLDERAVHHDESLACFYAWDTGVNGNRLVHMPLMHGPLMMLTTAGVFRIFGDSMANARALIAVCSLVALLAGCFIWPRRWRWWLAPLLFLSPILLFYSRFMREEMFYNAFAMVGVLGVTRALDGRAADSARAAWLALGISSLLTLLAIKENALFIYATAGTFFGVWWVVNMGFRMGARERHRLHVYEMIRPLHPPLQLPTRESREKSAGNRRSRRSKSKGEDRFRPLPFDEVVRERQSESAPSPRPEIRPDTRAPARRRPSARRPPSFHPRRGSRPAAPSWASLSSASSTASPCPTALPR